MQKYGPLTLILDRPAKPGSATAALRVYSDFERVSHKVLATNVDDPALGGSVAPALVKTIRDILTDQIAKKVRTGGEVTVTVRVVGASPRLVVLTGCYDQSKSLLVRANGTGYRGPGATKDPKMTLNVTISNTTGRWILADYQFADGSC